MQNVCPINAYSKRKAQNWVRRVPDTKSIYVKYHASLGKLSPVAPLVDVGRQAWTSDGHATPFRCTTPRHVTEFNLASAEKARPCGDAFFGEFGLHLFSKRVPIGNHLTRTAPQCARSPPRLSSTQGAALLLMSSLLKRRCFFWHFAVWNVPCLCRAPHHDATLYVRPNGL